MWWSRRNGAAVPTLKRADCLNSDVIRVGFLAYIISRGFLLLFVLRLMENEGEGGRVGRGWGGVGDGLWIFPRRIIATD